MAIPQPDDAFYLGTRYYHCVGDWALPDYQSISTGEEVLSTANTSSSVPANAIGVEIGGNMSHRAVGIVNTISSIYAITIVIPGTINSGGEHAASNALEPDSLVAGVEFAAIPFTLMAYITNHITDPEFTLSFNSANRYLTDLRIRGYWMP